jgi:hypothetical protein
MNTANDRRVHPGAPEAARPPPELRDAAAYTDEATCSKDIRAAACCNPRPPRILCFVETVKRRLGRRRHPRQIAGRDLPDPRRIDLVVGIAQDIPERPDRPQLRLMRAQYFQQLGTGSRRTGHRAIGSDRLRERERSAARGVIWGHRNPTGLCPPSCPLSSLQPSPNTSRFSRSDRAFCTCDLVTDDVLDLRDDTVLAARSIDPVDRLCAWAAIG